MCGRLPAIRNGRVDLSGTAVGSTATYSCDQGFLLVGEATRRCQLNGEWTGNEPFCRCTCLIITSCAKKSLQLLKTGFYFKLANYTDHCSIPILACSYRMLVWGCMSNCHPYLVSMHFPLPSSRTYFMHDVWMMDTFQCVHVTGVQWWNVTS